MVLPDGLVSVAEAFLAVEVVLLAGLGLPVLVVLPSDDPLAACMVLPAGLVLAAEEVSSWVLLSVEVVVCAGEVLAA